MSERYITVLKSKIHRVRVTSVNIAYEGSCLIAKDLLDAANIVGYEQIHVYNVTNGERFITYAISSSIPGTIEVSGAAAHKASVGDIVIICSYQQTAIYPNIIRFSPLKVFVDENNLFRKMAD